MELSMTVLRCPDQVAPETRVVSGGEFHVGRGPDVDWVLPDPDRLLSKRHFAVAFRGGTWQVADTSTNGTFLNTDADAIGRGAARSLQDGDRLRLGAYEIEIRLIDQPAQGMGQGMGGYPAAGAGRSSQSPFGDPFGDDPLAPPAAPRRPFNEPEYSGMGLAPSTAQLPHDFDPLAPDRDEHEFGGGFRGPTQADHSSTMDDALIPPPIAGYAAPNTGGIIPGDDLLPDDWDKDLLEGIGTPQPAPSNAPFAPAHNAPFAPAPAPFAPAPAPFAPAPAPAHSAPFARAPDSFADLAPPAPRPLEPAAPTAFAAPPEAEDFAPFAPEPIAPPSHPAPSVFAESPPARMGAQFAPLAPAPTPPGPAAIEDIDFLDPLAPASPAPIAAPVPAPPPVAAPVVRQRPPRPAAPAPTPPDLDPFDEPAPRPVPAETPMMEAAPAASPLPAASPFDEPSDAVRPEPVAAPRPSEPRPVAAPGSGAAPAAADDAGALAAFFKGAELQGANPADPQAMMTGLGQAFRALVAGLRAVLIARATIKSEFRIEQTMIRARGNNPLKFSANDDDALTALLGVGRRTDMTPAAAIEDSLRDLRLHELASMAAMQVAVRALLEELSPEKIRAGSDQGGLAVLPAQRKARAWDAFEARHASVVQALVDDFDSIFGKSFARAYERALDEISSRERQ